MLTRKANRKSVESIQVKTLDKAERKTKYPYPYFPYYNSYSDCYATFDFPDGSVKELRINRKYTYDGSLMEGATGTLTYKEIEYAKDYRGRLFVNFEGDNLLG